MTQRVPFRTKRAIEPTFKFQQNCLKGTLNIFEHVILNLYIVASRYEGGPQSIPECALLGVPIISTDVGIASEILDSNAIFNMSTYSTATPNTKAAYNNVQKLITPTGFERFNKMFHDLNEI